MIKYQIIIPAYNEADNIQILLEQINNLENCPVEVIVCNDGSSDQTEFFSRQSGATVLNLETNSGKGAALKLGFSYFLNSGKSEYVLCMDGDRQHPVSYIENFLQLVVEKQSKFIIGKRKRILGKMPLDRIISNTITTFLMTILTGQKLYDSQCGFRIIHRDLLKNIQLNQNGFHLESEMIYKAAQNGFKIEHVDIPTIYFDKKSNINRFSDSVKFLKFYFKSILRK